MEIGPTRQAQLLLKLLLFRHQFPTPQQSILRIHEKPKNTHPPIISRRMDTIEVLVTGDKRRGLVVQEDLDIIKLVVHHAKVHHHVLEKLVLVQTRVCRWDLEGLGEVALYVS